MSLLRPTDRGLYCEAGDFLVDPWAPVDRAVVTHAHGDHLTRGCRAYLAADDARTVMRQRLPPDAAVRTQPYGAATTIGGVKHPSSSLNCSGGSAARRWEKESSPKFPWCWSRTTCWRRTVGISACCRWRIAGGGSRSCSTGCPLAVD